MDFHYVSTSSNVAYGEVVHDKEFADDSTGSEYDDDGPQSSKKSEHTPTMSSLPSQRTSHKNTAILPLQPPPAYEEQPLYAKWVYTVLQQNRLLLTYCGLSLP